MQPQHPYQMHQQQHQQLQENFVDDYDGEEDAYYRQMQSQYQQQQHQQQQQQQRQTQTEVEFDVDIIPKFSQVASELFHRTCQSIVQHFMSYVYGSVSRDHPNTDDEGAAAYWSQDVRDDCSFCLKTNKTL